MIIQQLLEESAGRFPARIAVRAGDAAVTYGELAERVERLAAGLLALGLSAGDCVAVLLPNTIEFATTLLALNCGGLIAVPLFAEYPPAENREILATTAARALISSTALLPRVPVDAQASLGRIILTDGDGSACLAIGDLMAAAPRAAKRLGAADPDPIGIIVRTSGSTGRPKGVAQSQARLIGRADLFIRELSITGEDRTLTAQHLGRPLFLVADLLVMLRTGGCLTLVDPPTPDAFWQRYRECRPTYYLAPPGYTYQLLDCSGAAAADHSNLRFWINVGDRPGEELSRSVATRIGRPFLNMFGMTEAGFLTITSPSSPAKAGSIGRPMAGVEVQLVDQDNREVGPGEVGRMRIRSPYMMVGYWNDTLLSHSVMGSGWLETQDLMCVDRDGDYLFTGRDSETIVRTGANVASVRVVESLLEHPAIAEAVLVGLPDPREGQVPIAFYRLKAGLVDPGDEALREWVSTQVDAWSVPARHLPLDRWPMTPQGKIDKRKLLAMAAGAETLATRSP